MKTLRIALAAVTLGSAMAFASTVYAGFAGEQVWEATLNNQQKVCGIDYAGNNGQGTILTKGESSTDTNKAIAFNLKSNTRNASWKITEAKLVEGNGRFDFDDNLLNVGDKSKTSLFLNNSEYEWTSVQQERNVDPRGQIKLAPRINLDQTEFPLGTTKIQGKIVITCAN